MLQRQAGSWLGRIQFFQVIRQRSRDKVGIELMRVKSRAVLWFLRILKGVVPTDVTTVHIWPEYLLLESPRGKGIFSEFAHIGGTFLCTASIKLVLRLLGL